MESEVVISTTAKRCRCCMTPGITFKDLSLEYEWMGEKEVYVDMLLESFDIKLERRESAGWTICDPCIVRLRDSSNFKKQVLYSERCLLEGLYSDEKNLHIESSKMKRESLSDGDEVEDFETHYLDEDLDLDEDIKEIKREPLASTSEMSNDEDVPLSNLRPPTQTKAAAKKIVVSKLKSKQIGAIARPIKIAMRKDKLVVKKLVERPKMSISTKQPSKPTIKMDVTGVKRTLKINTKPTSNAAAKKESPKKGKNKDKRNTWVLVKCSNITPFKWTRKTGFRCFYCNRLYESAQRLLTHTTDDHSRDFFPKTHKFISKDLPINFDVTDMRCALCDAELKDIDELKRHLIEVHDNESNDSICRMIPFRLLSDEFACVVCQSDHPTFADLYKHTLAHFNRYMCNECGESFLTRSLHTDHAKTHTGETVCSVCGKLFASVRLLRSHVRSVHTRDRVSCETCGEKFPGFDEKVAHASRVHGAGRSVACPVCGKGFVRASKMRRHYDEVHLNLRRFSCDLCDSLFTQAFYLKRHKMRVHYKDVCV